MADRAPRQRRTMVFRPREIALLSSGLRGNSFAFAGPPDRDEELVVLAGRHGGGTREVGYEERIEVLAPKIKTCFLEQVGRDPPDTT